MNSSKIIGMSLLNYFVLLTLVFGTFFFGRAGEITRVDASTIHLVPDGKSLDAIYGDWIMKNDQVVAVIGDAVYGREANMRVQSVQGAVIDFTSLVDNNDYLAAYYPHGIPGPDSRKNPAMFADRIEAVKAKGKEIQLDVYRSPSESLPYHCKTTYVLRDGERFLRVTTTYTNNGTRAVTVKLSDKLRLDLDNTESSPIGKHNLAFLPNKWFNAAYGIYAPKSLFIVEPPITGSDPAVGLLVNHAASEYILKKGEQVTFERFLLYGKDVAELQREAEGFGKVPTELCTLQVADKNGRVLDNVFVDVLDAEGRLISQAITDVQGQSQLALGVGSYRFVASKVGHDTVTALVDVKLDAQLVRMVMRPRTGLKIIAKDSNGKAIPVKVEFKGMDGTADPFLGTPKRAEGADNFYYTVNDDSGFLVPVPPGKYLVSVSHGPEYEVVNQKVTLSAGLTESINVVLVRAFDTPGWMVADLHNHTTRSGDNDSDTKGRIINMAASGIEFAPATEHNRISTYTPEIIQLGLQRYIASAPGIELTGPTGIVDGGPNHQNAFPLTIQVGKQGGGFPAIDGDVHTQLSRLYAYDNDKPKLVQHNHPGYGIPKLYFDRDEDGELDDGYATRQFTDVIELQNFIFQILDVTKPTALNEHHPAFYWLQMLNQGDRIFATTTSDGHYVSPRSGERFVYIRAENDTPESADAVELALNAKSGRMVMTNGPFLDIRVNGGRPGDDVSQQPNGKTAVEIDVFANNEIRIDRIQLLLNGRQVPDLSFTRESHPELFSGESRQFHHRFSLALKEEDVHIIAVATGTRFKEGVEAVKVASRNRPMQPTAVSNPIFVDVDGGGFRANMDKLGKSLPKGKVEVLEQF